MASEQTLDPVTFEVLKNSFITSVDQMGEQILRTCYSFVIYNHDFSSGLHDANGDCAAQGNQDIAVHVGTLHFTCKEVMRAFEGDMHDGDVFAINDPYAGGTHFPDVRLVRPIFSNGRIIAFAQSNGHWSDVGGSVPGSFDVSAKDMFREGLRITPVRLFDKGVFRKDVATLIASNTRDPASIIGDIHAQAQATQVCEREILRLVGKYGRDTVETGLSEVQDYVERAVRHRIAALPDGEWETVDFIDRDPAGGEGMIPIRIKMTIRGDKAIYDFTGSHPVISTIYNSAFGTTFSAVAAGMKTFFPDLPLNSGFYRAFEIMVPEGSIVDAKWPVAVTGFLMPFEKIMNSIYEMWSRLMPERALACAFNLEYLLTGGRDARSDDKPIFMFYDWLPGGWGGRNGKDGANVTTACFGTGMMAQPVEGQERANPILTTEFEILPDSAVGVTNPLPANATPAAVAVDFVAMGAVTGNGLLAQLPAGQKANVVTFPGPAGSGWAESFNEGFKSAVGKSPNVKILDEKFGDSGVAVQLQLIQDALQAYPAMNVIWGTAPTAEAAIGAVAEAGRTDIKIMSSYENQAMLDALNRGDILAFATQYPVGEGAIAIDQAVRLLDKKPVMSLVQPVAAVVDKGTVPSLKMDLILAPSDWKPVYTVKAK